jgi:hypothetical protein
VQKLEAECPSDGSLMKNGLDDLLGTIGLLSHVPINTLLQI